MRIAFLFFLGVTVAFPIPSFGQVPASQYERGSITAVGRHANAAAEPVQYDVSVKVRNTMYVVLYTPPNGANLVEYAAGMDLLVSIGDDTLTFPSKLTGTTSVPILRKEELPPQPAIDWSKAPGQYFEMKMQNLTANLDLTREQQSKFKPIVEQEASESSQFCFTSSIPRKERLKRWEKIVRNSDEKMRAFLTPAQWEKLQEIRKDQKKELKQLVASD